MENLKSKSQKDNPAIVFEFKEDNLEFDYVGFGQRKMSVWHLFTVWLCISKMIIQELEDKKDVLGVKEKMINALRIFDIEDNELDNVLGQNSESCE